MRQRSRRGAVWPQVGDEVASKQQADHANGAVHAVAASAVAHPNIALVKYWGKRPGTGNLPAVGSLSVTLAGWRSHTTVRPDATLAADACTLDGKDADAATATRWRELLDRVRALTGVAGLPYARVVSDNNFPTASGLASSASGYAALTLAATHAYGLALPPPQLSALARSGSGSAARSLFGGFVQMDRGEAEDGHDAVARPLHPAEHWPLQLVVAITARGPKEVGSTEGMERTRKTSPFWRAWVEGQEADLAEAARAIAARDFAALADITEHSCLKMHALAHAARPGLVYFSPATLAAMQAVRALRARGVATCFTVDAGPQLKALCLPEAADAVAAALNAVPGVLEVARLELGEGARLVASP